MSDFQQKRRARRILYSKFSLFLLIVAVVVLARATYDMYGKEQESAANYAAAKASYDGLTARQTALSADVQSLGTASGIDAAIREKFSVAKPGETVVMVVDATDSVPEAATSSGGFWHWLAHLF